MSGMNIIQKLNARYRGHLYVAIGHGGDHCVRRVHFDGNGHSYVRLFGTHERLSTTHRDWYPLNFRTEGPLNALQPDENVIELRAKRSR